MNYGQALDASKNNPERVLKVLEGLAVECPECKGSQEYVHFTIEKHRVASTCKYCTEGKIHYSWTPQVGEWCVWQDKVYLIYQVGEEYAPQVKADKISIADLTGYRSTLKNSVTPILEWEEIERVLGGAGYSIDVFKYDEIGKIYEVELDTELQHLLIVKAPTRQEAVMKAVLELGKEVLGLKKGETNE